MVTIACVWHGHNTRSDQLRSTACVCVFVCMCVSCVLNFLSFTFCLLFFRFLCDSSFVLFDFSAKLQKKKIYICLYMDIDLY